MIKLKTDFKKLWKLNKQLNKKTKKRKNEPRKTNENVLKFKNWKVIRVLLLSTLLSFKPYQ